MRSIYRALLLTLLAVALVQPVFAKRGGDDDDDHKGRKGPRTKIEQDDERYRYEYRDRRCKYKYEYSFRTGKTKVEEKGDCGGIAPPHPVVRGRSLPRVVPVEPQARRITCNREILGSIIGGAVGATIGSKVGDRDQRGIATVGGAVIGAVIGGSIGRSMDEADHACAAQALEYAELNQAVNWENGARHASFTVTPVEGYRSKQGAECRKYLLRSTIEGRPRTQTGRACRQRDGSWRPIN